MNKKSILVVLSVLALVAASVFGTLAYLTDTDQATNTFTVGQVGLKLDEKDVDDSTPDKDRDTANKYHLLPGHTYVKDPTVHVDADSEDCYLFVTVANGIADIEILFGNLFEPVGNRKFDVILFNTPYLPTEDGDVIDDTLNYAFDGGLNGRKVIDMFLDEVGNHLNDGGIVQMIQSSLSGNEETLDRFDAMGFISEIKASEHFFFEDITLINAYKI